jgi:hypothetical protein
VTLDQSICHKSLDGYVVDGMGHGDPSIRHVRRRCNIVGASAGEDGAPLSGDEGLALAGEGGVSRTQLVLSPAVAVKAMAGS